MRKIFLITFCAAAVLPAASTAQAAVYGGGSGTAANPYQIWTPGQMNTIGLNPADWVLHFKLMADIDMSGISYNVIGGIAARFTGTFDGNGHVISNLAYTDNTDYKGMFGYTGGSTIKNLTLENAAISGGDYSGALVGFNYGTISNCFVSGSVQAGYLTGGLVGRNNGTITDCQSRCTVSSSFGFHIGGLVGRNDGTITGCEFNGDVTGDTNVGGIAGQNYYGSITKCRADGTVWGRNNIGGLVGLNYGGSISKSCADGSVGLLFAAQNCIGGLVGLNQGSIIDSYSASDVNGKSEVGGLVGRNDSYNKAVTNCYAQGLVQVAVYDTYSKGGLIGLLVSGAVNSCFWDSQTCGTALGVGNINGILAAAAGKTTTQMMTLSTYINAGWDFTYSDGDAADWMMLREFEDYPRLAWQTVYAGDIAGLYGVDVADFLEIAENWLETGCPTGCEQADIDLSGTVNLVDFAFVATQWLK